MKMQGHDRRALYTNHFSESLLNTQIPIFSNKNDLSRMAYTPRYVGPSCTIKPTLNGQINLKKHRSYEAAHLIWTLGGPLDEAMDVAQSAPQGLTFTLFIYCHSWK